MTCSIETAPASERKPARWWSWLCLGFVLLFVVVVRYRLREMPLERDEGEFAYGGQLLLKGSWPGHSLYTLKLPGTHAAYAVWMALFGQNCAGVHLGFLLTNCLTLGLLFLLTRSLIGNIAACVAAAVYALTSLSADTLGTSAHATHLVVFFALAGLLLLWRAACSGRVATCFAAGICLGGSVLMKHNGLLFVALGLGWLIWLSVSRGEQIKHPLWKAALAYLLGTMVPLLLLLLILWRTGTLAATWFWSVEYARAYAKPNPGLLLTWLSLVQRMPAVIVFPFYTALVAVVLSWATPKSRPIAPFAMAFLLFSLAAVVPGLHFRQHYYVLLLPALAFLCGVLVQMATDFAHRFRLKILAPIPALLAAGLFLLGVAREQKFFFHLPPRAASRLLYGFQPFPEALVLADYLRAHSPPNARVAVLGSEPEIYFYAQRRSATGYVYTYPLTENQPFAPRMREQMREEIATAQPQFIVQARSWTSWLVRPGGQKRIDGLCALLMPPNYKLIAACDFFPAEARVVWHWPPEKISDPPGAASELLLFERVMPEQAPASRPLDLRN